MASRVVERGAYGAGRSLIGLCAAGLDLDVGWQAPLPDGPKIICSNHPTTSDPFLLLAQTPGRVHILITHMAFDIAVLGRCLRASGHVPVVDGNGRAAFDTARSLLEAGESVVVYPEATSAHWKVASLDHTPAPLGCPS